MDNNKKYDYDQLNEMCDKVSLLDYASKSYEFKKVGSNYFCSCPKHSDSTPSLCIDPKQNRFYCFSCGTKGNLINWLIAYEKMKFPEAVEKVAELSHTDLNNVYESETVSLFKLLKKLKTQDQSSAVDTTERKILDPFTDYYSKYKDEVPQEWIDEGIPEEELRKYEIRVDTSANRIVYPVYDSNFHMIGVKGRTRFQNYKELHLMKYMNYYKLGGVDYFAGMKQAYDAIMEANAVIIVEGLKSVMKLDAWGYHNVVSAETSVINDKQTMLLIKMGIKDVTIAFDKDVGIAKIRSGTRMLCKYTNVYVAIDQNGLLDDKDSPPDKGPEVWKRIYEGRIRI